MLATVATPKVEMPMVHMALQETQGAETGGMAMSLSRLDMVADIPGLLTIMILTTMAHTMEIKQMWATEVMLGLATLTVPMELLVMREEEMEATVTPL